METGIWIETYKNQMLYPHEITEEVMDIEIVAHALSNICRFNGHSNRYYSVAEHSVWASVLSKNPKYALLHDAAESVLSDIATPVKNLCPEINDMEEYILSSYLLHNGLRGYLPTEVKAVDKRLCWTEAKQLGLGKVNWGKDWNNVEVYDIEIKCLTPNRAKKIFLKRYNQLFVDKYDLKGV